MKSFVIKIKIVFLQLIESQTSIGLLLLSTTIEELAQFNEDSTVKRCQQMKMILNQQSTQILQILHLLLKKPFPDSRGNASTNFFIFFIFI